MQRILRLLHEQTLGTALRQVSLPVPPSTIASRSFQLFCHSLIATMIHGRAAGLAAPQCGNLLRVICLLIPRSLVPQSPASSPSPLFSSLFSPPAPAPPDGVDNRQALAWSTYLSDSQPVLLINPTLTLPPSPSPSPSTLPPLLTHLEACLSLPQVVGNVTRPSTVHLSYLPLDPPYAPCTLTLTGFDAAVAQHEVDHLDGRLFIDRIANPHTDLTTMRHYRHTLQRHTQQRTAIRRQELYSTS